MSDQERRRWKAMVRMAKQKRADGIPTVTIDVDLLLVAHDFMMTLAKNALYERDEHYCPS